MRLCASLMLVVALLGLASGAAAAGDDESRLDFSWSAPVRYAADDADTLVEQVPTSFSLLIDIAPSACDRARGLRWTVDGRAARAAPRGQCEYELGFGDEG